MAIKNILDSERCQIQTPPEIIAGFWKLIKKHRASFGQTIDLGAGDGRFAVGENFSYYEGFEIDKKWRPLPSLPKNAVIKYQCAFASTDNNFDACIGNPPYVRHHNIEKKWRAWIKGRIDNELDISLNELCNLFVYFMCLAILKTKDNGLVALIVPYEWVSRPSVKALREYIYNKSWDVHVYRFREEIFSKVLTTASITVIDKGERNGNWKYYDIDKHFSVFPRKHATGTKYSVLPYTGRANVWAMRGLSPGTQKVFTLSEGERVHFGLKLPDVRSCVTSLRDLPKTIHTLTKLSFKKYFIDTGAKCWLIRSDKARTIMSESLKNYLLGIPRSDRNTSTCKNRRPWYLYLSHPAPKILYSSGFTAYGPKFLVNKIGAIAIGSVHGIHSKRSITSRSLREYLTKINFEKRVVGHAGTLKKVEVKQMNGILSAFLEGNKNG